MFTLRFDMRAPAWGAPIEDLYAAAVTVDEATELVCAGTILPLLPLCGGLAPEVAWPCLERAAEAVARAGAGGAMATIEQSVEVMAALSCRTSGALP